MTELGSNIPALPAQTQVAGNRRLEEYVLIQLEEDPSIPPTGLFIGHNGDAFMLKPGVPAKVPQRLLNVLDDAVLSMPVTDTETGQVVGYRDRRAHPYRILPMPTGE